MDWLAEFYKKQLGLQMFVQEVAYSEDLISPKNIYNSATSAVVEIGEMLQTDTRWKQYVTGSKKYPMYKPDLFKEEFADVFIYLMNVLIYAGIDIEQIKEVITNKQHVVFKRFEYDK